MAYDKDKTVKIIKSTATIIKEKPKGEVKK